MCSLDGYGKFHLFGCDHEARINIGYSIDEIRDQFENSGGYIP
jgi:hypothetical protein